jgi:hypothetical protein
VTPDLYEIRWNMYPSIKFGTPARQEIPGLRRWLEYTVDTDCALEAWEERANAEWQPNGD